MQLGFTPFLVGLAVFLTLNRVLVPKLNAALFWSFQALQVAFAAAVAVWGIPELEHISVARYGVTVLLVFHAVQNVAVRYAQQQRAKVEEDRRAFERERYLRAPPPDAPPRDER